MLQIGYVNNDDGVECKDFDNFTREDKTELTKIFRSDSKITYFMDQFFSKVLLLNQGLYRMKYLKTGLFS